MNLQDLAATIKASTQSRQSRFFGAARKGENYELRADLNSEYRDKRKDAIKRVIANMTVGKDVSGLFPDVLKNMQTEDLEQKKLVYLYLMNYAKTQPELVILAVNTFVKDTDDPNPLIRALAIRTMGCLRAEKILDYLCDPLRKCLRDDSPYVRKTAAICVAKLYDLRAILAIENGFVQALVDMLSDANPMVVANAVTALSEIQEISTTKANNLSDSSSSSSNKGLFTIDSKLLNKLLIALGECTEWGRIAILTAVATYKTADEKEAEHICERVVPQFQHANPSVVLAAIKVILLHLKHINRPEFIKTMLRKMAPPLVTLVSSAPEVQWVALRNINLILQKRPEILSSEMRVFFCKYNDPPYVKSEKLEIMIKLATEKNVDTLLSELKEYASEADVDFVRKAVRAIGLCAIKVDEATDRCVDALMELTNTRVSYIVQEAIIVLKDIFRKFPQKYEGVIPTLCSNLEDLDEPEAKASLIWMIGEYADRISNADELLERMLKTIIDEPYQVQLQTLTAVVKLFLKRPESAQNLVQKVLTFATKTCDNADIRDRAYIYWRLLSADSNLSKEMVLAQRPPIQVQASTISPALLEELLEELSSLASVYHKPVETFVGKGRLGADEVAKKTIERDEDISREKALQTLVAGQVSENLLDMDDSQTNASGPFAPESAASPSMLASSTSSVPKTNALDDLLGLFDAPPADNSTQMSNSHSKPNEDLLDGLF